MIQLFKIGRTRDRNILSTGTGIGPDGPSRRHRRFSLHRPRIDSGSFGFVEGLDVLFHFLHSLEHFFSSSETFGRCTKLLFHLQLDSLSSKFKFLPFSLIVQRIRFSRGQRDSPDLLGDDFQLRVKSIL